MFLMTGSRPLSDRKAGLDSGLPSIYKIHTSTNMIYHTNNLESLCVGKFIYTSINVTYVSFGEY